MFFHIQFFISVLKAFGSLISLVWGGSMLKSFAPLYVKPIHFSLGFSGTLRFLFVILLRAYFFSIIVVNKKIDEKKALYFILLLVIFIIFQLIRTEFCQRSRCRQNSSIILVGILTVIPLTYFFFVHETTFEGRCSKEEQV